MTSLFGKFVHVLLYEHETLSSQDLGIIVRIKQLNVFFAIATRYHFEKRQQFQYNVYPKKEFYAILSDDDVITNVVPLIEDDLLLQLCRYVPLYKECIDVIYGYSLPDAALIWPSSHLACMFDKAFIADENWDWTNFEESFNKSSELHICYVPFIFTPDARRSRSPWSSRSKSRSRSPWLSRSKSKSRSRSRSWSRYVRKIYELTVVKNKNSSRARVS